MSWATNYIEQLTEGKTVKFRPRGGSMKGKIESGQLVTIAQCSTDELSKGDIVLCKVGRAQYLHLIKCIKGPRFQIGNNLGRTNGWIGAESIFGKCISIDC
jgi:hypothetical protein